MRPDLFERPRRVLAAVTSFAAVHAGPLGAAGVGLLAFLALYGPAALDPTRLGWLIRDDFSQHLLGWLFFRNEPLRFPLGALTKAETRAHAQRLGLPVAEKAESQDICFVPDGDHASVVTALRPEAGQSGEIVDDAGRVLGRHKGLAGITVGQRRGLGVAAPERMYVTEIDPVTRRVTIAPRARARMRRALLDRLHLVGAADGVLPGEVMAKHRYNEPAQPATLRSGPDGRVEVEFREPQLGIARGQACVLYDGSRLVGGGWIEQAAG